MAVNRKQSREEGLLLPPCLGKGSALVASHPALSTCCLALCCFPMDLGDDSYTVQELLEKGWEDISHSFSAENTKGVAVMPLSLKLSIWNEGEVRQEFEGLGDEWK